MNHTVLVRSQLHKSAEIHNADNRSCQNLSRLNLCDNTLNNSNRLVDHSLVCTADGNTSIVADINFHACLLNDLVDHLALFSYHIANLLRVDSNLLNLRRKLAYFFSRLCNHRLHDFIQNIKSGLSRLGNRFLDDRSRQSVNLNIHLDRSNSLVGSAYLKVHVAEEIL